MVLLRSVDAEAEVVAAIDICAVAEEDAEAEVRVGKKPEILKKPDKTRVFSNKPVFSLGFFKAGFFQINQYTTI